MRFKDLLDQHGVDYRETGHEHCRRGWIQIDCPSCSEGSKHFRLGYNIAYGYFNCWSCGRLKLLETTTKILGVDFTTARGLLSDLDKQTEPIEPIEQRKTGGKLILPKGVGPLLPQHKTYLRKRGFDWRELEKLWDIKGISISTNGYSWRVFIPIYLNGKCVSWTTRSINDSHAERYRAASLDAELLDRRELLYGIDYCRHSLVICEGPTDVWKIGPGSVCTFGTGFSRSQVSLMAAFPVRAVCYDAEPEGQRKARELCDLLEVYPGDTYNICLRSKDPGSATRREVESIRRRFLDGLTSATKLPTI